MKRNLISISFLVVAIYLASSHYSLFPKINAQESQFSLGIYPPLLEIKVDPPADVKANITIQNLADLTADLNIVFRQFRASETGTGNLEYINEDLDPAILQKLKLYDGETEVNSVALDPFESRTLTLKINFEPESLSGDYYFSVIFQSQQSLIQDKSQSQIQGGIGTNVILSVGSIVGGAKGGIKEFSTPLFVSRGPVPLTLFLENKSSNYVIPTGRISISDMLGREVGLINILPQHVLSNSSRFMIDSDQASPTGELRDQIIRLSEENPVLIWQKNFLLGIYTANAHIKLSENGPIFETKTRFVAIPVYILLAISFVAFVLIGIYFKVRKKV